MGTAGFARDMGWQGHGGSCIRKSKGQTAHMPCVDSSILLAPGCSQMPSTEEHHPLLSSGRGAGVCRLHPLTWKTLGAETRQANAEERVAPKIPAVMRGPNPDTMLMLCMKTRGSGTPQSLVHQPPPQP